MTLAIGGATLRSDHQSITTDHLSVWGLLKDEPGAHQIRFRLFSVIITTRQSVSPTSVEVTYIHTQV